MKMRCIILFLKVNLLCNVEHKKAYDGKFVEITITCWDVVRRLQIGSREGSAHQTVFSGILPIEWVAG